MSEGLPLRAPVAVVDLDDSSLSRRVVRNLSSSELVDVAFRASSYAEALELVKSGKAYGFFIIPRDFMADAVGGRAAELSFYSDLTFFIPGTLTYKGFMATAVTASGGLVKTTLTASGLLDDRAAGVMLQPMVVQTHLLHNPWTNYSYYLSNSFIPGMFALVIFLITAFSVTTDIKQGTSPRWLAASGGNIYIATFGTLAPQTLVFTLLGFAVQALFYRFCGFPLHCPPLHMLSAWFLMVVASQAFALFVSGILVNMRLSLSVLSLLGILAFSVTGFSFPVEQMYPYIGVFSYLYPVRWYFLIYIDQALNGLPLYYSRFYYVILILFTLLPLASLWKLRRHCLRPVYLP
ncbi:MAG: hypothetical protein C7K11_09975 [Candidatus Amulumruptor caecigallinarius]|nr:MAG: hypothetical protein C7K11_09975 [Candidatus Amulumruptor caecigallinarius]